MQFIPSEVAELLDGVPFNVEAPKCSMFVVDSNNANGCITINTNAS